MGVSIPPDGIGAVVRKFLVGMQVPDVAPDATTVARGGMPRAPVASMGPAAPHYAQPVGGVMGTLLSAGPVGERMLRQAVQHPIASAGEVTGVAPLARGVAHGDLGSLVQGALALAPMMGAMRGAGAVAEMAPAAAEAASGGMSEGQLQNWRGIEGFLNNQNSLNRSARESRTTMAAMRSMPRSATPAYAQRALDMAIPTHSSGDADMLRNMMESGFAGGKPATAVELPVSGAGRGGSTSTAMAAARKLLDPTQLRAAIEEEVARRGGASSPEVTMAASEEVARKLASQRSSLSSVADSVVSKGILGTKLSPDDVAEWAAARNDPAYQGTRQHIGDLLHLNRQARDATKLPVAALQQKYGDAWGSTREVQNIRAQTQRLDEEYRALEEQQATAPSYRSVRGARLSMDRPAPPAGLLDFLK